MAWQCFQAALVMSIKNRKLGGLYIADSDYSGMRNFCPG